MRHKALYKISAMLLLIVTFAVVVWGQSVQASALETDQVQALNYSLELSEDYGVAGQTTTTENGSDISVASDGSTYIYQGVYAGEHRSESTMLVGNYNNLTYYSYIHFPIGTIAPSIINSATLRVYYSNTTVPDGTFTLYGVTQAWSTESISYTYQPYTVQLGTAVADEAGYIEFDVTESIISVVIGQYEGYGFKISYSSGTNTDKVSLYTLNYSVESKKPQIIIDGSLYVAGESGDSGKYRLNNHGTFKFLIPNDTGEGVETTVYSSQITTETFQWDIYNVGTVGHSVLLSVANPTKVLSCSGSRVFLSEYTGEISSVPESCRWNIFAYGDNECILINAANGKILTVSGNSVATANTFTDLSTYKWRIGYISCTAMSIEDIDIISGAFIPYSVLVDNIVFTQGVPTNSRNPDIYTLSTSTTGLVTLDTSASGGINIGAQSGMATVTIGRKDTDVTCALSINIVDPNTSHFMKNVASGYVATYNNSTYLTQQEFVGGTVQQWAIEPQSTGYVMFKNLSNNSYLQVYNNSSASNTPIVFASQNSASSGQLFKLIYSRTGVYNIMAKCGEANGYYIGTQTELLNAFVGQGSSLDTIDTSLGDWHLIPAGEKDATLVAVPEADGRDRSSFFDSAVENLERMDFDEVYQNHEVRNTAVAEDEILYHMANSKITVIRTHGNWNVISTSDGGLTISDIQALDDDYFDYSQLVIYGACLTGQGGATANNLVTATAAAGVDTVIGFQDSVPTIGCNYWCLLFFEQLEIWYDEPGITMDDIVYCTDIETYVRHQSDYSFVNEDGEKITLERPVVVGSQELPS